MKAHCLLDVPSCQEGYEILGEPCTNGVYPRVVQLDDNGDTLVFEFGQTVGACDLCLSDSLNQTHGIQATVYGNLTEAPGNSEAEPPILTVTAVRPYDAMACEAFYEETGQPDPSEELECLASVEPNFCISGFVMDTTCIEQGFYFDNTDADPLREPETHTVSVYIHRVKGSVVGMSKNVLF